MHGKKETKGQPMSSSSSSTAFTPVTETPNTLAHDLMREASELVRQGKVSEAITQLTFVIEMDPENALAYSLRGSLKTTANPNDKSNMDDLNIARALNPDDNRVIADIGFAWLMRGELVQATSHINRVLKKDRCEKDARGLAYFLKAIITKVTGDHEGSEISLCQATSLGQDVSQFQTLCETIKKTLASKSTEVSSSSLSPATSETTTTSIAEVSSSTTTSGPTSSSSLVKAKQDGLELRFKLTSEAMLMHKQGRSDDAILILDRLIQADPTSHSAYTMRGNIKMEKFPPDLSALQDFESSLSIKPDGSLLARKGMLWYIKGNSERAHSDQDEVLSKYSDDLAAVQLAYLNKAILFKLENEQEKSDLNLAIAKSVRRSFHGDSLIKQFDFLVSALREHRKIFADQAPPVSSSSISQPAGVLIAPSSTSSHSMSTSLSTSEPTSNQTPIVVAPEISSQVMPAKTEQEQSSGLER